MPIPFAGNSYHLAVRKADVQRAVNLHLVQMEQPSPTPYIMDSVPGLSLFATLGDPVRGMLAFDDRCFVVAGGTLYELDGAGVATARGTLSASAGRVSMAGGLSQIVIVEGASGYVFRLATNAFERIADTDFTGASHASFLDNYFVLSKSRSGQRFQITAINDATNIDALDFASAESAPDDIVASVVDHSELWLLGETTTEVWFNSGAADFPFARNRGAAIEVGCHAPHSVVQVDSRVIWIGQDRNGSGIVYVAQAYQPLRVSTDAVEQALQASTDLSAATAFAYQQYGKTFYCIDAPGLSSTWVLDVGAGHWHERCDVDSAGHFERHRGLAHAYAFKKHLLGGSDGKVYVMDRTLHTNAGDPLVRERTSPHDATPGLDRLFFRRFVLNCTTGEAPQGTQPQVELAWSNDSGASWGVPMLRSSGRVGERFARVTFDRLGSARDRVWKVRFSENAPFAIVGAEIQSMPGRG